MVRNSWHLCDYLSVLEEPVTLGEFAKSVRSALAEVQLEVLAHGNILEAEARVELSLTIDGPPSEIYPGQRQPCPEQ